jgi:hypothetical protein
MRHARRCQSLAPGGESNRLMALCELQRENWADAWGAAKIALESEELPRR